MAPKIQLVSGEGCMRVDGARAALDLKGAVYTMTLVDLSEKPAWFVASNPRGRVPALFVDDHPPVHGVPVMNELIDELLPGPALLPVDPIARARARTWIAFAEDYVMAQITARMFERDERLYRQSAGLLLKAFGMLQTHLVESEVDDWFCGDAPGLVEAAWAPAFAQLEPLRTHWGLELPASLRRVHAWAERIGADPRLAPTPHDAIDDRHAAWRASQLLAFEHAAATRP